jgi:hypothetical protein
MVTLAMIRKTALLTCSPWDCGVVLAPWVVCKCVSVARIATLVAKAYSISIQALGDQQSLSQYLSGKCDLPKIRFGCGWRIGC